ncbi:hypothetical protein Emed_007021 [Eimeria media]
MGGPLGDEGGAPLRLGERGLLLVVGGALGFAAAHSHASLSAVKLLLQQLRKLPALGSNDSKNSSSSSSSSVGLQPLFVDGDALLKESPCLVRMAATAVAAAGGAAAAAGGAAAAGESAAAAAAAALPEGVGPYFECLLSHRQVQRHGRQLLLASWGVAAQRSLSRSKVLLVGAGGLGGPIALYLTGAGIGHLTIADGDGIDATNLHREVDVGRPKSRVLVEACRALDSQASVVAVEAFVNVDSALELVESHDVVIDATDSRATRYLLNDACVLAGKPLVCGSALRAEGQAAVFNWRGGPCYRCLFPPEEAKGPNESKGTGAPNVKDSGACDTHGVLGLVPALIGLMQAMAALQIAGDSLSSKEISSGIFMQTYDGSNSHKPWRSFTLRGKQKTCIGGGPPQRRLGGPPLLLACLGGPIDTPKYNATARPEYAETCWYPTVPLARRMGGPQFAARLAALGPLWQQPPLSFEALLLRQSLKAAAAGGGGRAAAGAEMLLIIDVRPATHFAVAHLPFSLHWPLESLLSYTEKRQQKAAAAAAATAGAAAAHHEELLGCTYTSESPKPQQTSVVFVCRRGRDSSIATEAVHALLSSSGWGAPSSGVVEEGSHHGGPLQPEGPLKVYNLDGGLEGLVRQGLISMPVP